MPKGLKVWCIPEFGAGFKSALFQDFLLLSAVLRVRGRSQNPRRTPVRTKLRLKRLPKITTESPIGAGSKIRYGHKKTLRRLLRNAPCFPKVKKQKNSGVEKLTRSSLKGLLNRAIFACKNRRFCKQFSPLRYRTFISPKKANLSFKSPSPKPHLNRTGSAFALPKNGTDNQNLRPSQNTTDSRAVVFFLQKGPLLGIAIHGPMPV